MAPRRRQAPPMSIVVVGAVVGGETGAKPQHSLPRLSLAPFTTFFVTYRPFSHHTSSSSSQRAKPQSEAKWRPRKSRWRARKTQKTRNAQNAKRKTGLALCGFARLLWPCLAVAEGGHGWARGAVGTRENRRVPGRGQGRGRGRGRGRGKGRHGLARSSLVWRRGQGQGQGQGQRRRGDGGSGGSGGGSDSSSSSSSDASGGSDGGDAGVGASQVAAPLEREQEQERHGGGSSCAHEHEWRW